MAAFRIFSNANKINMANNSHLPIKIVAPRDQDLRQPEIKGGRTSKLFVEVTKELRDELDDQVTQINDEFQSTFAAVPGIPGVARITLRPKALAQSHCPTELLQKSSCPVIGTGGFGELFIGVSSSRLANLSTQLRQLSTKNGESNISAIQAIEPFTAATTLGSIGVDRIKNHIRSGVDYLKFRLFNHAENPADEILLEAFLSQLRELDIQPPESIRYGSKLKLHKLRGTREESVDPLVRFLGTQALSSLPIYRSNRS